MGRWTVLKSWNQAPGGGPRGGLHESDACLASRPKDPSSLYAFACFPVVKEHQEFQESSQVPEFTIAVSYQPKMRGVVKGRFGPIPFDHPSLQQGWKWSICWTSKDGGRKMRTGYGFQTPGKAKGAAESKAKEIALAELPEEVYTYRPEL